MYVCVYERSTNEGFEKESDRESRIAWESSESREDTHPERETSRGRVKIYRKLWECVDLETIIVTSELW